MKIHKIIYEIGKHDFEHTFKRKPKDKDEFDKFCHYCKNGIAEQIDWDILFNCAKEAMEGD